MADPKTATEDPEKEEEEDSLSSSSSDSDSESDELNGEPKKDKRDSDSESDFDEDEEGYNPRKNVKRFVKVLTERYEQKRKRLAEKDIVESLEEQFNFPEDKENWKEEDLLEYWGDAPYGVMKPGWDPSWVDEDEAKVINMHISQGKDVPIAPFYVPYRRYYPAIPNNHPDIKNPKDVIEELDRIEEFLKWVSFIFADGSSYEGTVWDDLAHGKGVYVGEKGLVRYEGEWVRNDMEGHGVVEVDIPHIEPVPGSKLEAKMRAQGKIIKRDFMSPEDKKWLEMDMEDAMKLTNGKYELPFYENDEWVRQFGRKPEKGRYRYAGQWKHARMHGCGIYEVNERTIYGRFYFGEYLEEPYGCDAEIAAMHAGIAEVAAAKARMFTYKPDGMVREERGPYSDPQHPYFYEEDDVWMAPGFVHQFYEVPDYFKAYMHDVDEEREMWLNSFYRAPLRLPMPAELEYWWAKDEQQEFVLLNEEPEPDPEDPSKLIYKDDPVILHIPTGRIINYVEDEEHGLRLFWQPIAERDKDIDPAKVQFLPLGFDDFYGRATVVESGNVWERLFSSVQNKCKLKLDNLGKWLEEKKKESETTKELFQKELELAEAELTLKEATEDLDDELKRMQQEEEKKVEMGIQEEDDNLPSEPTEKLEETLEEKKEDEEEVEADDDDEEEITASSFGSVDNQTSSKSDKDSKAGKAPFGASSLSFAACSLVSAVPPALQHTFMAWKEGKLRPKTSLLSTPSSCHDFPEEQQTSNSLSFPSAVAKNVRLRAVSQTHWAEKHISKLRIRSCTKQKTCSQIKRYQEEQCFNILSLHTPLPL